MDFKAEVLKLIKQIPRGSVSTPNEIARFLGDLRALRAVRDVIRDCDEHNLRVVDSRTVSNQVQRRYLKNEGIRFDGEQIVHFERIAFKDFLSDFPLKKLRDEQSELSKKVLLVDDFDAIDRICGIDVAYSGDAAYCALAIFDYKTRDLIEVRTDFTRVSFPYIPTYLSYREFGAMKLLAKDLNKNRDILFADGHGILHPRRSGLATFIGVRLDLITIGIAKSRLCGKIIKKPKEIWEFSKILFEKETRGYGLKTSKSKRLIYISPGHRISLKTAYLLTKEFTSRRIPEPLRTAHNSARKLKLAIEK